MGYIKDVSDFYKLDMYAEELCELEGYGTKSVDNLITSINNSKFNSLERLICALGIPNVGKSSLINRLAGSNKAKTADKPGVTRAKQWIRLAAGLELLDTPGILWPKFDDMNAGLKLAFTGAINDEAIDRELITSVFLDTMIKQYPERIKERYKIGADLPETSGELLELIGRKRGCLLKGGIIDLEKVQRIVLTDFRSGKLGTISLDMPPEN